MWPLLCKLLCFCTLFLIPCYNPSPMQTPVVDPRAVQLGSLFVRGLTYLIAANSACGFPFPMGELMPWKTFDGLLFHSKYLQAHSGSPKEELLEGNVSTGKCHWPCLHLVLTFVLDDPITSSQSDTYILISPQTWHFKATRNPCFSKMVDWQVSGRPFTVDLDASERIGIYTTNAVVASSNVVWLIKSQNVFSPDKLISDVNRT